MLLHKAEDDDFWALPGGRSQPLEPATATLRREMVDERGQVGDLAASLYNSRQLVKPGAGRRQPVPCNPEPAYAPVAIEHPLPCPKPHMR